MFQKVKFKNQIYPVLKLLNYKFLLKINERR